MIKGIERGTYERDKGLSKAILTTHNNNLIYGLSKYMLCSFVKITPFERREHCMRLDQLIGITYFWPSVLVSTIDFRNHFKKILLFFSHLLLVINSSTNMILYIFLNKAFRMHFVKMLKRVVLRVRLPCRLTVVSTVPTKLHNKTTLVCPLPIFVGFLMCALK